MRKTDFIARVKLHGKVTIPAKLDHSLNITKKDAMEVSTENNRLILCKEIPACTFCGSEENLIGFKGKNVCKDCILDMKTSNK